MFKLWRDKNFLKNISVILILFLIYFFFILGEINRWDTFSKIRFFKFFQGSNPFKIGQLKTADILYRISHKIRPKPAALKDIVVVSIDDESFKIMNKKWPWPRIMQAELLYKLKGYGAKVIGFDFAFVGESVEKEDDLKLAEAIRQAGNTIIVSYFDPKGRQIIPNREFFTDSLGYGFVNKPRDFDYYVRQARVIAFTKEKKIIDYSFEIKALCRYLGIPIENVHYDSKNGVIGIISSKTPINIPVRKDGSMPIVFNAKMNEFTIVPFWKVVKGGLDNKDIFKDKIVLVGLTSEIFHDIHHTPLGLMPGTILIANTLLTMLQGNFIKDLPWWVNLVFLLLFGLVTALCTYRLSALKGLVIVIALIYLFAAISWYAFIKKSYALDYFSPFFIVIITYLGVSLHKYIRLLVESSILKTQAIIDSLTGLYLRRYMDLKLQSEFEKAVKFNLNLSVVMVDIDHFKSINDTYGHQAGDIVLKNTAAFIHSLSRKSDVPARFGGEEFCVILPGAKEEGASIYAERLRKTIEESVFSYQDKTIKVTASFGIVNYPKVVVKSTEELLKCADMALYKAKESGRNRLCVYSP